MTDSHSADRRVAAIDVGSNSIRLIIAEEKPDGRFRVLDEEKETTRLGRGVARTGALDPQSIEDSVRTIDHFRSIAEGLGARTIQAIATAAIRAASNGEAFLDRVRREAKVDIEVISAEEEARLAFKGVAKAFDLRGTRVAVVDVGGGSTEIVLSTDGVIERICLLDIGAVVLTEMFGRGPVNGRKAQEKMRRYVRKQLAHRLGRLPFTPQFVIGMGGTFTNLASMSMHEGTKTQERTVMPVNMRGYEVQRSELRHFLDRLRQMSIEERAKVSGLNPDRADIIVAGFTIIDCVLKALRVNWIRLHDQGIRAGLIQSLLEAPTKKGAKASADHGDRLAPVREFAEACRSERGHAEHVAMLALRIHDQLRDGTALASWVTPRHRELLEAAALLHDVGYLINYAKHHKHTYHLVRHSDLAGFTRAELELIANIARYHRGSMPKLKHAGFGRLSPLEQESVRNLAGILRIAVGLDRSHTHVVRDVKLRVKGKEIVIDLVADQEPAVELWGAGRKCDLLSEVSCRKIKFRWEAPESSSVESKREVITSSASSEKITEQHPG